MRLLALALVLALGLPMAPISPLLLPANQRQGTKAALFPVTVLLPTVPVPVPVLLLLPLPSSALIPRTNLNLNLQPLAIDATAWYPQATTRTGTVKPRPVSAPPLPWEWRAYSPRPARP